MAAPNREVRIRYGPDGLASSTLREPFRANRNEKIVLDVFVEDWIPSFIPPAFAPVNVTGWTAKWVGKLLTTDTDGSAKWNVSGTVVSGPLGHIQFTIPKATLNFTGERIFGEWILIPSGSDPMSRIKHEVTIAESALTI